MKKIAFCMLFALFPVLLYAETGALSFAPPPTDVSVSFLGNVFGIVDGILHGSGSQILGTMFGVFNAAVLALGGIVIMYTLMVSTINTAHEGQMLGQKWSSIWVPVRSTLGLTLLIPKASGYCLMQVFFMWVVVQGVGAADKVWDAALGYLNRGGVIIQQQINPITSIMGGGMAIANGAATILYGQTCMLGLQTALTTKREAYLNSKSHKSGPCATATPNSVMDNFCNTAVPDFLESVNAVSYQNKADSGLSPGVSAGNYQLPMPNFDSTSPYASINGICGTIYWNALDTASVSSINGLKSNELDTAKLSRAIAIQQMYTDLSLIAQIMVNNDPQLVPQASGQGSIMTISFAPFALQQYGIPYTTDGRVCLTATPGMANNTCTTWGQAPGNSSALFNGTEFAGAISDYNAVMLPTLNLINQAKNTYSANEQRQFINKASADGWMLAGSYFFSLVNINTKATTNNAGATPTDKNSGLEKSIFKIELLLSPFENNACVGTYADLCTWFSGDNTEPVMTKPMLVKSLIDGSPDATTKAPSIPSSSQTLVQEFTLQNGFMSSNVYGFVNNSLMIRLPGQPGMSSPTFMMNAWPSFASGGFHLDPITFPCGRIHLGFWTVCLEQMLGDLIYNLILVHVLNFLLLLVTPIINSVVMAFLYVPLVGIGEIFTHGVAFIELPDVNPIVALANMGTNYINFVSELWIYLLELSIGVILLFPFGIFILILITMSLPLLTAWLGTMATIGFVTAYYIPFLPYIIFTFGSIGWLMAVIEAMVAAPLVALGITHPEGEGPFGKGEHAIMIILNIFLRPAMMIIGFIAGIILSYVSVWIINAGFSNVLPFFQGPVPPPESWKQELKQQWKGFETSTQSSNIVVANTIEVHPGETPEEVAQAQIDAARQAVAEEAKKKAMAKAQQEISDFTGGVQGGYTSWAGIYAFFFSILIYTTLYLTVVQKAFTLITSLPDKVLRWIGGSPEQYGGESAQWAEEGKKQVEAGAQKTEKAQIQMGQQMGSQVMKGANYLAGTGPDVKASPE